MRVSRPILLLLLLALCVLLSPMIDAKSSKSSSSKSSKSASKPSPSSPPSSSSQQSDTPSPPPAAAAKNKVNKNKDKQVDDEPDEVATVIPDAGKAALLADRKRRDEQRKKRQQSAPNYEVLQRKKQRLKDIREKKTKSIATRLEKAKKRNAALKKKRIDAKLALAKHREKLRARDDAHRKRRLEAAKHSVIQQGQTKLKWLLKESNTTNGMIDSNDSTFKKYVHGAPRPYWLFLVMTATGKNYQCDMCKKADKEMKKLARIHAGIRNRQFLAGDYEYDAFNASLSESDKRSKMPVFIVRCDIDSNRGIFNTLNIQSAPIIMMIPPTAAATPAPLATFLSGLPNKYKLSLHNEPSVGDFNEFIEKHTGKSFALTRERASGVAGLVQLAQDIIAVMDPVRFLLLCVGSSMVVLLLLLSVLQQITWALIRAYRRRKGIVVSTQYVAPLRIYSDYSAALSQDAEAGKTCSVGVASPLHFAKPNSLGLFRWWFAAAGILVYLFGISGGMYNILRGHGHYEWKGWNVWNYVGGDDGGLEGLAMGLVNVGCASVIIFANRLAFADQPIQTGEKTIRTRLVSVLKWLISCLWSPVVWGVLLFLLWRTVLQVYTRKHGHYHHGYVWHGLNYLYYDVDKQYRKWLFQATKLLKQYW